MKHISAALIVVGFFALIAYSEALHNSMRPLWALWGLIPLVAIVHSVVEYHPKKKNEKDNIPG